MSSEIEEESGLIEFEWEISEDGYRLERLPDELLSAMKPREHYLKAIIDGKYPIVIYPNSFDPKVYKPAEMKLGIAREFANLASGGNDKAFEDSVLNFANSYGLLGISAFDAVEAETLESWTKHIENFRKVFKAVDAKDDDEALELLNIFSYQPKVFVQLDFEHNKYRRMLKVYPENLLSAMWFMAADELTTGIEYIPCANTKCTKWFKRRGPKKCCSNKCRTAYHR